MRGRNFFVGICMIVTTASLVGLPLVKASRQDVPQAVPAKGDRPIHEVHDRVPDEPREPMEIAKDRRAMSFQALEMMNRTGMRGNPVANQPMDIYLWSVRMLGAEIYTSMDEGEMRVEDPEVFLALPHVKSNQKRSEAFRAHWDRMKAWEDRIRPLARTGTLSHLNFLEFEFRRLQAELWLAREIDKQKKLVE
ncbi:MAG: hypothetical protein NVSMB14_15350 [Isosphaeraceae bacterium]